MKRGLVVSDFHLGTGHRKGEPNLYDDFREDARFAQLLAKYRGGDVEETLLVLNGDIFDLLKVPVNGTFPDAITERLAAFKLEQCLQGHPVFIRALADFLDAPHHRIVYQPGNHDAELFFPTSQRLLCRAVTGHDTHPRFTFTKDTEPFFTVDGVQFHHGHQFEALHAHDFKRMFLTRGQREPILNLPWGSLFVLNVLNHLVAERPYVDKVMPFWPLIAGGMLFDTRFTVRMLGSCVAAFAKARFKPVWWSKRPFEKISRFVRNDLAFFERLDRYAERIFEHDSSLHGVVMGHTHLEMVRTFRNGAIYVNTGTWIPMVSLKLANLGQSLALHYALIEWPDSGPPRTQLMRWHGQRPETEEVIV